MPGRHISVTHSTKGDHGEPIGVKYIDLSSKTFKMMNYAYAIVGKREEIG